VPPVARLRSRLRAVIDGVLRYRPGHGGVRVTSAGTCWCVEEGSM
jgi:hypothetical protein